MHKIVVAVLLLVLDCATAFSAEAIELNVQLAVPEWGGKVIQFKSEEDAYFDGKTIRFLDGRQEKLHLIPRQ